MRMVSYYVWIAALTMVAISQISGRKNHFNPAIFQEKIPSEACIRIFTGLGDMGCRSHSTVNFDSSAQYGILFEILAIEDSNKSLNELAIVDTLHLELPLAVICPGYLLQNKIFAESLIAKSDKISGLIIYDEKNIEVLSPDSATPALKHQEASDTLEKEWQPGGSGNLHRSFPFPIYRISFQHAKLLGE